jgi:TPR repeat protein
MLAASLMSDDAFGGTAGSTPDGDGSTIADFFDGLRAWELKEEPTAAAIWLRAAEWGDVRSMEKIGELFERGEVVPHDTTLAYFWFSEAAQRGLASAKAAADRLHDQLPADHLSEVDANVGSWKPRPLATAAAPAKKPDEPTLVAGGGACRSFETAPNKKPDVADLIAAR